MIFDNKACFVLGITKQVTGTHMHLLWIYSFIICGLRWITVRHRWQKIIINENHFLFNVLKFILLKVIKCRWLTYKTISKPKKNACIFIMHWRILKKLHVLLNLVWWQYKYVIIYSAILFWRLWIVCHTFKITLKSMCPL